MDWASTRTLVTGGASFIGSHLVEALLDRGASVRVVDNLSSGRAEYLRRSRRRVPRGRPPGPGAGSSGRRAGSTSSSTSPPTTAVVATSTFTRPRARRTWPSTGTCSSRAWTRASRRSCSPPPAASTPTSGAQDPDEVLYLTEDMAGPPYDADNMYGWAKLMGEMTLAHLADERGLKAASLPLLHGVRRARQGGPRGHRDDRSGVPQAGPVRRVGRRPPDPQLDLRRPTSSRARSLPPSGSTTAPP